MNAEHPPDTLAQFTKVFAYRPNAIVPYALGLMAVTLMVSFFFWAFARYEMLTARAASLLTMPVALMAAYTLYLWVVAKTARLVVTEHGLVYSDRWVRRALLWSEISHITRFVIRSKKGKGIALKLGLTGLENWQELINLARELSDAQILI
ncbi:hypothetical protein HRbin17_02094 [bacterium HR17]|jgi:hypothetical protein|uniref:Uncharacterized protein n=1 Tax=Candidatus Fervidibacter japonicus TaxID=2035412 RepID=A0A2H5XEG1_9BACT|nr:hypothetical protein HRbin17_02094 [bacterium HR17]